MANTKPKGVQVSGTIAPELNAALEDYRWSARKTKTELVRQAVEEFAANHNLTITPTPEAPTSSE